MMPKSSPQPRKTQSPPWRRRLLFWGCLVALVFAVGLVVGTWKKAPEPGELPDAASGTAAPPTREVLLYFAATDGQALVAESRHIDDCPTEEACLRGVLDALIAGPRGELAPILPAAAVLRGVAVADNLVRVDFSRELIAAHPGGTQSELLTVYGLADTLAVNFPHLRQLQLLVEGAPVATLKGHVDLRQPIVPDFSLVEEGLAPTGDMSGLSTERDE